MTYMLVKFENMKYAQDFMEKVELRKILRKTIVPDEEAEELLTRLTSDKRSKEGE